MVTTMLSLADFSPHVDSIFRVFHGVESIADFRLSAAHPLHVYPGPKPARAAFELLFISSVQQVLPQSLYTLRHAAMGELEIFLVPTARDDAGVTYCATFN